MAGMNWKKAIIIITIGLYFVEAANPVQIMMQCLQEIIWTYISPGQVLVFSLLFPNHEVNRSTIKYFIDQVDETTEINHLLHSINKKERWSFVVSTDFLSYEPEYTKPNHCYVLFLMPDEELDDHVIILESQLANLQSFGYSFNRTAYFILVVIDWNCKNSSLVSKEVLNRIWYLDKILNAITLIPTSSRNQSDDVRPMYDIYALSPFDSINCGKGQSVILIDQWTPGERFLFGNTLLPRSVPSNLGGCTLTVSTTYFPPFMILTKNYTDSHGNFIYDFEGTEMVVLKFIGDAMNFTVKFHYNLQEDLMYYADGLKSLMLRKSDVLIGGFMKVPETVWYAHATVSFSFLDAEFYVPCPKRNPSFGNILKVFALPAWLLLMLVLFLQALLFWYLPKKEIKSYRAFSDCFLNVWAMFLSVSVQNVPKNAQFRIHLLLFISYCFFISTVYQSFFTSFFIEPGYEKELRTIDDLNEKDIPFGIYPGLEKFLYMTDSNIIEEVKHKYKCANHKLCSFDTIVYRNLSTISDKNFLEYIGSNFLGLPLNAGNDKNYCSISSLGKIPSSMFFIKGDPLLSKFDYFILRCLEGGFVGTYWSQLTRGYMSKRDIGFHATYWKSFQRNFVSGEQLQEEGENQNLFTVLSLLHLKNSFLYLLGGLVLSFLAFVFECVLRIRYKDGE